MWWYLSMLVPTAGVNVLGLPCPLTVWEKHFWRLAGETPYQGGFNSQYFVEPFYAPGLRPGDDTILLVAMVVWSLSWLLYSAVSRLRMRSSPLAPGGQPSPKRLHRAVCLSEGDELDAEMTSDGILLRPRQPRDPDQWWYWTDEQQSGEQQIAEDRAAGRQGPVFSSGAESLAALRETAVSGRADRDTTV